MDNSNENTKVFKFNFTDNYLKYIYFEKEKEVCLDICNIDYNNVKTFFILLKKSVDYFLENGYKTFLQYIPVDDFELLDKEKWKIRKEFSKEKILYIECDLNSAILNIAHALGFRDINLE